ncbi:MAG: hypothetical protein L0229_30610, partial [Blastocatellia bacterium]|nr:hypothetical protein [Blastocatellia bacterium]
RRKKSLKKEKGRRTPHKRSSLEKFSFCPARSIHNHRPVFHVYLNQEWILGLARINLDCMSKTLIQSCFCGIEHI